jgi:hypothetical protein
MNITYLVSLIRFISSLFLIIFIVFQKRNEFSSNVLRKDYFLSLKNKEPFLILKWSFIFLFLLSHILLFI